MHKTHIIWEPFPGSQKKFLKCPVWECLLHGNRGGGKTDVLIMDFLQAVGKGFGPDYKGLLLREATTELGDVISKCRKWIPRIFPTAKYNASKKIWVFEEGETLWLNYARTVEDYDQYHGHEYPWIGWEEITNHVFDTVYLKLMSCNRSSNKDIVPKYRSTCNPSGPGHAWVKQRFIDKIKPGKIYREKLKFEYPDANGEMQKQEIDVARTHVQSYMTENKALLEADPAYMAKIYSLTQDNEMLRKAWIDGSWDLLIGGFFTDVWDKNIHILPTFQIPTSWKLYRSFDWGSSRPWAVTYGFESNGEQPEKVEGIDLPYFPVGSVIIPNEIYGWTGTINEGDRAESPQIAQRVLEVDNSLLTEYNTRCIPGPADTSIWEVRDGTSIGNTLSSHGCHWTRAYKGSGSRIAGWAIIRQMLGAAKRGDLETPHLYFFAAAQHHIRTLPLMQRDKRKPEDIDTDLEDHCFVYDTEIITDKGIQKIGNLVGKSGKVLSVNGQFVDFSNCRLTRNQVKVIEVVFSDKHRVICTPDHNFLTSSGFVKAENLLTLSDTRCIVSKSLKENLLCGKLKGLLLSRKQNRSLMEKFITNVAHIFNEMVKDYIEKFGYIIKEKFLKGFMFIIKNPVTIIKYFILNYYHNLNTYPYIQQNDTISHQNHVLKLLKNGIKVRKVKPGTNSIMKILKKLGIKILIDCVLFAEKQQKVKERVFKFFALGNVKRHGEKNQELTILQEVVQYVPVHLQLTNMHHVKPVQVNAVQNYEVGIIEINILEQKQDVYCLEAEGTHSFALKNGVIVSNCMDSLRYLLARKLTTFKRKKVRN